MEDRLSRIEHITAGIAEQRKQDRDEYRQLWRDTQRQIAATNAAIERFVVESRETDARLSQRIDTLAETTAAANEALRQRIAEVDRQTAERIESLVSAIGEFIRESKRRE